MGIDQFAENSESEVLFNSRALQFWRLKFDPIYRSPLQFGDYLDYEMLVKTRGIIEMTDLKKQFEDNPKPMILIVEGDRGSGKSTAIHYLFNKFYQDLEYIEKRKILPIFCGVTNLVTDSAESIRKSFHLALLDAIIQTIRELRGTVVEFRSVDLTSAYASRERGSMVSINDNIYELLRYLSMWFQKTVLFVDNLDKADPSKYGLFEDFFLGEQDFLEYRILKHRASILFTLQPFMYHRFKNQSELSYLGDKSINVQTWQKKDLDELIFRRLCLAYQGDTTNCRINHFFDPLALEEIYTRADYTPRHVLIAIKYIMQKAADMSEQKQQRFCLRPISKAFCSAYLPEAIANIQRAWFKIFATIDTYVASHYHDAFAMVKESVKSNPQYARELLDTLLLVWISKNSDDKNAIEILCRQNLIHPLYKEEYEVAAKVSPLLSYLFNTFSQDKNQVRYYFLTKVF